MPETINTLIAKSLEGEVKSGEELLMKLKPLILSTIKYYYNSYDLYDDLIQEGYEIVLKALGTFEKSKGVHFLGYVKLQLRFYYLDKLKGLKSTVSLNQFISSEDENIELLETLEDPVMGPEEQTVRDETLSELWTSLMTLTDRQREVIILYYLEGRSIAEISKRLNITYRTVVNIKAAGMKRMKEKLATGDNDQ